MPPFYAFEARAKALDVEFHCIKPIVLFSQMAGDIAAYNSDLAYEARNASLLLGNAVFKKVAHAVLPPCHSIYTNRLERRGP